MWIEIEIDNKKYYLMCKSNEENNIDCVLYDGSSSWLEVQPISIILKRSKELNKRIQFDEATVKETLQKAQPVEISWEGETLKLKYRVQSCPFHFSWHFNKQTEHEFQRFILFPLFRIVQGLSQQNEELREIINKKDVELKQYKIEGAVLKRVTVSTQPFNFIAFDQKFSETIELSKTLMQISDALKEQYSQLQKPINPEVVGDQTGGNAEDSGNKDLKLTPRRKRRKYLEEQQRVIANKLRTRNKALEYESSQSQPLNSSESGSENTSAPKNVKPSVEEIKQPIETKPVIEAHTSPPKRLSTQTSPKKNETSPAKKLKLDDGLKYIDSDSSADGTMLSRKANKPPQTPTKSSTKSVSKTNNERLNTQIESKRKVLFPAQKAKKESGLIYEDSESTAEDLPLSKVIEASTSRQAANLTQTTKKSPTKSASLPAQTKKESLRTQTISKKKETLLYEDSESSSDGTVLSNKTGNPPQSPTKSISQCNESTSEEVQNLIDEWKDLEKRRVTDLNTRDTKLRKRLS